MGFKGRVKPLTEGLPTGMTLPGDVKERLQFKPLKGGKKRTMGEDWTRFESDPKGPLKSDDCVGAERTDLGMNPRVFEPGFDDVNIEERREALARLSAEGAVSERDALSDRGTEAHNEHLYEEVEDKQTGKKGLLFRNNYFDRM